MLIKLSTEEVRVLTRLRRALEALMAHDPKMSVTQVVVFIHMLLADEDLSVRKLGTMLGRDRGAAAGARHQLTAGYYRNKEDHPGCGFLQQVGQGSTFKATARGEAVARSLAALLG